MRLPASLNLGRREELDFNAPLFRVHLVVRTILLVHAWIYNAIAFYIAANKPLLVLACLFMGVWTAWTSYVYITRQNRPWFVGIDVAVTMAVIAANGLVMGWWPSNVGSTIAGMWIVGAPLAAAISFGVWGGLLASLPVAVLAWAGAHSVSADALSAALVPILVCVGLGYMVEQIRRQVAERDVYYATAAALGERERLNRIVHDGVLQVLAMVEREGKGLGPRGEKLAQQAREQEVALRALLQGKDVDVTVGDVVDPGRKSLSAALDRHETQDVTISMLADDVSLSAHVVDEIDAVVGEVLSNVRKHAGPGAQAFVLLEEEDDEIILSIADNGVGADPDQILAAAERGRFGVQDSIQGRIRDLGGTATMKTAPGRGVEWEFRIPREL